MTPNILEYMLNYVYTHVWLQRKGPKQQLHVRTVLYIGMHP